MAREEGRCLLHCCDDGLLQYKEEEESYEANIPDGFKKIKGKQTTQQDKRTQLMLLKFSRFFTRPNEKRKMKLQEQQSHSRASPVCDS